MAASYRRNEREHNAPPSKKSKRDVVKEEQPHAPSDVDDVMDCRSDSLFGEDYDDEREATGDVSDGSENGAEEDGEGEGQLGSGPSEEMWWDDPGGMSLFPFIRKERLLFPVSGNEPVDYFR